MGIEQTLHDLKSRHQELESALADALAHPATGDDEITALKRQKLRLKDQIAALELDLRDSNAHRSK
jgi:hypothetical protein